MPDVVGDQSFEVRLHLRRSPGGKVRDGPDPGHGLDNGPDDDSGRGAGRGDRPAAGGIGVPRAW